MVLFPKIQSPCPYANQLANVMDGDTCRLCQREVFDISQLSESEQRAFFAGCRSEVCVSYKFPLRAAVAAAASAAVLGVALPAAAQDVDLDSIAIIVGGITDPKNVDFVADPRDEAVPELPILYEGSADAHETLTAVDSEQEASIGERPDLSQVGEGQ
jgi:hypothetical protein